MYQCTHNYFTITLVIYLEQKNLGVLLPYWEKVFEWKLKTCPCINKGVVVGTDVEVTKKIRTSCS